MEVDDGDSDANDYDSAEVKLLKVRRFFAYSVNELTYIISDTMKIST